MTQVFYRCGLKPKSMLQQWRFHLGIVKKKLYGTEKVLNFEKKSVEKSSFSTSAEATHLFTMKHESINLPNKRREGLNLGSKSALENFSISRDFLEAIHDLRDHKSFDNVLYKSIVVRF